ncbi:hypothetical protein O7626_16825 [Micromonospora sp. WMMD1102]|uniref:hypothetical protein n=1 Tax=Micromonospora sp. WMMD1102 TaxID=3016105 RepID=UPI0024157729|nr:hypothetical protein [Micromonospora sp. WMMD1102]MDG4787579.1 hypothetical protein [Micromonospora sp. WMMD1102]
MIAIVVLAAMSAVVWWFVARSRRIGWTVGLALLGWAVVATVVYTAFPRARADVFVGYLPVAVAIVGAGRAAEVRRLGRAEPDRGSWPYRLAIVLASFVACVCAPFSFYVFNGEPYLPSADELLPVPAGLTATVEEPEGSACGSGACGLAITVTGNPEQSVNEVHEQIRQHLTGRGWDLGHGGESCRPTGWILDQHSLCVSVFIQHGQVHVSFTGWRAWP